LTLEGDAMNEEEASDWFFYHKKADSESRQEGIRSAASIDPDVGHVFLKEIPNEFGNRWSGLFAFIREQLIHKHGDNTSALIELAVRYIEYSRCSEAAYSAEMRAHAKAADVESEGWASAFFERISYIEQPTELLNNSPFTEFPSSEDMLQAIALF
jgi:hypothetical protein